MWCYENYKKDGITQSFPINAHTLQHWLVINTNDKKVYDSMWWLDYHGQCDSPRVFQFMLILCYIDLQ